MKFALILILVPILLSSIEFAVPEQVYDADIVDIDNDNDLDIVIASLVPGTPEPPDSLTFLINNGYGEFTKSTIAKNNFSYMKMVDIDCDGLLDICTKNSPNYQLVYYKNLGNLQFGEAIIIPVDYTYVFQYPKFSDMDSDGDMDIVINYGGSVHSCNVLINNGDGIFIEENIISYVSDIGRFDIGDINNDGFEDILIATNQNTYLVVNNNFQFTSFQIDDMTWAKALLIDMDGDFDLDIVLNQDLPSQTMIIYNDGTGDFYEEHLIDMFSINILKDINDYNSDGYPDFAFIMNIDPPNLYISFNNGDGTISVPDEYNFDVVNYLVVKSADLNGNGYNDLLVASHPYPGPSQGASIIYNDGNGNFIHDQIPFLQVIPNSIHLDCDAGNTAFEIRSNSQWQIEQDATWITSIEPISGTGTTTINVDFEENPNNYSRSVTLNISGDNVESEELVITQSASNVACHDDTINLTKINLNNYPNPFNPTTTINYTLPFDADKTVIEIYNVKGELIKRLKVDSSKSRNGKAIWDGRDTNQKNVSSGIYLYLLKIDESVSEIKKMIMIK